MTVGNSTQATFTSGTAAIQPGQLGINARFINKHQMADIPSGLLPLPQGARPLNVGPVLLGGARRFFYSSSPSGAGGAIVPSTQSKPPDGPDSGLAVPLGTSPVGLRSSVAAGDHGEPGGNGDNRQSASADTGRSDGVGSRIALRSCG